MPRIKSDTIILPFQQKLRQALQRYTELTALRNIEELNKLNIECFAPLRLEAKVLGLDYMAEVATAQAAGMSAQGNQD